MKKLLGILVLGLLWCNNANAASIFDYLNTGMTKKQVKKLIHGPKGNYAKSQEFRGLGWSVAPAMCFKGMNSLNKYFSKYNTEITTHYSYFEHNYVPWYVFENVTKPIHMKTGFCKPGTGTLKAVVFSKEEAYAAADPVYAKKYEEEEKKRIADEKKRIAEEKRIAEKPKEKKITSSSQSSSTDDKIAQAKQICKDLGFKTKTEKFADCSLKMLSMQFEVQNRESSSDGGTQQKIVVNQGYSVGDAMIALSGIISDANNVRSSYGGGNCRIFQHAYHASLKCN